MPLYPEVEPMTGLIRTAYATHAQPEAAVRLCREQLGLEAPDSDPGVRRWQHVPALVLAALQASFGDVPLTGGSAAGAISTAGFGYSGFEIGLMAFKGADVTPSVLTTDGLAESEAAAGRALGLAVRQRASDGAAVMLLFDSVASSVPLRLHPASQIMEGFQAGLGDRQLHVIGGGLLTDINLSDGWLFCEGEVRKHAMVALVFPPGLRASTAILHGCRPVSTFMDITRIDGAEVLELNHEPALTVVERMLGLELGTTSGQQLSLVATLGQKQGDPFAPYDENQYVNRLILQANPERGSITLFEPDFAVGTRVQIMSRDNALMLEFGGTRRRQAERRDRGGALRVGFVYRLRRPGQHHERRRYRGGRNGPAHAGAGLSLHGLLFGGRDRALRRPLQPSARLDRRADDPATRRMTAGTPASLEQLERELQYYKAEYNDIGARLLRLQEEQGRVAREARRSKIVARLVRAAYQLVNRDIPAEAIGDHLLAAVIDASFCDRAALLTEDPARPGHFLHRACGRRRERRQRRR